MTAPKPPIPATPAQRVFLIADDLTGACDAAAAFLPGHSVRVSLGSNACCDTGESVQAFNTDSRDLAPEDAARAVAACARNLPSGALLFKKLDSAGRGSIAAELLAAHRAFNADLTLLAPSFPAHGRIVREGILYVQHASGHSTQLSLLDLFEPGDRALIDDPEDLAAALTAGKRVAICNAETQPQLEALAHAAAALPGRILYAGSAGLARALASMNPTATAHISPLAATTLLIIGTPHPVTQLQLRHLEQEQPDANLLLIRSEADDAERVRQRFAQADPEALVITGGDTALLTLRSLGARSIKLRGEIAPGIPWGIIDGGLADGRIVVTKSGGFGPAATLTHIFHTLSGNA